MDMGESMTKYYAISYEAVYDSGNKEYRSFQGNLYHARMLTHKGLRRVLNKKYEEEGRSCKVLNIQWLTHQVMYG
jgi:hypothetical protein